LKSGGYYGIHELVLQPENISKEIKQSDYKDLRSKIQVHLSPLTISERNQLLEDEGFEIVKVESNAIAQLKFSRFLAKDGFFRTIKIMDNVITHTDLRKCILQMCKTFKKHKNGIKAVANVVRKKL